MAAQSLPHPSLTPAEPLLRVSTDATAQHSLPTPPPSATAFSPPQGLCNSYFPTDRSRGSSMDTPGSSNYTGHRQPSQVQLQPFSTGLNASQFSATAVDKLLHDQSFQHQQQWEARNAQGLLLQNLQQQQEAVQQRRLTQDHTSYGRSPQSRRTSQLMRQVPSSGSVPLTSTSAAQSTTSYFPPNAANPSASQPAAAVNSVPSSRGYHSARSGVPTYLSTPGSASSAPFASVNTVPSSSTLSSSRASSSTASSSSSSQPQPQPQNRTPSSFSNPAEHAHVILEPARAYLEHAYLAAQQQVAKELGRVNVDFSRLKSHSKSIETQLHASRRQLTSATEELEATRQELHEAREKKAEVERMGVEYVQQRCRFNQLVELCRWFRETMTKLGEEIVTLREENQNLKGVNEALLKSSLALGQGCSSVTKSSMPNPKEEFVEGCSPSGLNQGTDGDSVTQISPSRNFCRDTEPIEQSFTQIGPYSVPKVVADALKNTVSEEMRNEYDTKLAQVLMEHAQHQSKIEKEVKLLKELVKTHPALSSWETSAAPPAVMIQRKSLPTTVPLVALCTINQVAATQLSESHVAQSSESVPQAGPSTLMTFGFSVPLSCCYPKPRFQWNWYGYQTSTTTHGGEKRERERDVSDSQEQEEATDGDEPRKKQKLFGAPLLLIEPQPPASAIDEGPSRRNSGAYSSNGIASSATDEDTASVRYAHAGVPVASSESEELDTDRTLINMETDTHLLASLKCSTTPLSSITASTADKQTTQVKEERELDDYYGQLSPTPEAIEKPSDAESSTEVVVKQDESQDGIPPCQLSIRHLDLVYHTVNNKMICRICLVRKETYGALVPVTTFNSVTVSWAELSGHCMNEHPAAYEDLIGKTDQEIRELKTRLAE